MELTFVLNAAGFTADEIVTKCDITLEDGAITSSHLAVTAKVPGIDQATFDASVADAKANYRSPNYTILILLLKLY